MLLKPVDHMKKTNPFSKPYKGIVVDNDDPKKLGRIKVNIQGFLEGLAEELPWIFPENPTGLGGRADLSSFIVPEVSSRVQVEFPFDDIYAGFYTGYWQSDITHQGSTFDEDYPESYGFRDSQGTHFKVNKSKKFVEVQHTSGARIRMNDDSSVEIQSRSEIRFVSEDQKTELKFDMVTGNVNFDPKETMEVKGNKTRLSAPVIEIDTSTKTEEIAGGSTSEIVGGRKEVIGGSYSQSVVGDRAISNSGNKSELIAGETEVTYGQGKDETVGLGDMVAQLIAGDRNIEILLGNYLISLLAGNYDVDIVAGNVTIKTAAGELFIGNSLGTMEIGIAGNIKISALPTLDLESVGITTLKGSLTKINSGISPVITVLTDPIEDYITGFPKRGVPTVLAGA